MESICISCGMPMKEDKDFALNDRSKSYCVFCSDENGNLKSYEEVLEGWSNFIIETEKIEKEAALIKVKEEMASLPAWKSKGSNLNDT